MKDVLRDLTLTRLLASGQTGASLADICKALEPLLEARLRGSRLTETVEKLLYEMVSLLQAKGNKVQMLKAGRQRAASFLGIPVPKGTIAWPTLRDEYLTALCLGVADSKRSRQRVSTTAGLRAEIIRQALELPLDPAPTIAEVKEALAWHLLSEGASSEALDRAKGMKFTAGNTLGVLLYSKLGIKGKPDATRGIAMMAAQSLQCVKTDAPSLRVALIGRMLDGRPTGVSPTADAEAPSCSIGEPAEPVETDFPTRVRRAAEGCTTGRFGANRVFISHVYEQYLKANPGEQIDEAAFKRLLVEANHDGSLTLARADITPAMDASDVEASRTVYLTATFHYVVL